MSVDLKGALKFAAVIALLASAWFVVRMLKPREAELSVIDTRDGDFGDMTSAAQKRAGSGGTAGDVSGLDMVPASSLPLSGPEKPAPAPEPAPAAPQAASTPAPEPAPTPAPAGRPRRVKPVLQRTESTTGGQTATSSAFMAAPEDAEQKDKKK
jgi:hypothetical protein